MSTQSVWRAYGRWFIIVGAAFFSVYPLSNWLTAQREAVLHLYWWTELDIPFLPGFVWVYLSLYALFLLPPLVLSVGAIELLGRQLVAATLLSGFAFLIFPAQLGFPRQLPDDPLYHSIFSTLFSLDQPHNLAPSLHVAYSALIIFAASDGHRLWQIKSVFAGWLLLICTSTILVHQHHLIDVASGLLLARILHWRSRQPEAARGT